jgi:hypothetical protein
MDAGNNLDLIYLIASYLDVPSIIAWSLTDKWRYLILQCEPVFWKGIVNNYQPQVSIAETYNVFRSSLSEIHEGNIRGLFLAITKPGNFSKLKKIRLNISKGVYKKVIRPSVAGCKKHDRLRDRLEQIRSSMVKKLVISKKR